MTTAEVNTMIESIGFPSAYYEFTEETAKPCPFVVFYYDGSDDMPADNINFTAINRLVVELYTDYKDLTAQKRVQDVLTAAGIYWTREEGFIDSERMWMARYQMEVLING